MSVRGLIVLLLLLAACSGGGGGGPAVFVVVFDRQPLDGVAGNTLDAIQIRAQDDQGNPLTLSGPGVTLSISHRGTLPAGRDPGLAGSLTVALVDGIARFDDLILTGASEGYILQADGGGSSVASTTFAIAPAGAFRVAFAIQPGDTQVGVGMAAFDVEILDSYGNAVNDTPRDVELELATLDPFGRDMILHASGTGSSLDPIGDAAFEYVDCEVPFLLPPEAELPPGSVDAMTFDEFITQLVYGTTLDGSVFTYDPFGGEVRVLGGGGTLSQRYKGLYVLDDGTLFGLPLDGSEEFPIHTTTGVDDRAAGRPITWASGAIVGFQGAALDPVSGTLYAAARIASDPNGAPRLLAVDGTNVALSRGELDEGCSGLTTKFDGVRGTLFAVSPDGPRTPTLFELNVLNAAMTPVIELGNGTVGEAITYVFPAPVIIGGPDFEARTDQGRATYEGLTWSLTAQGVQLRVVSAGLLSGTSEPFDITAPDLDVSVSFTVATQTWAEGSGAHTFSLVLSRAAPHDIVATVDPNGPLGTASPMADTDFRGVFHVIIPAGETRRDVTFIVEEDSDVEGDEILDLRLTGVAPATLGTLRAQTITLTDND